MRKDNGAVRVIRVCAVCLFVARMQLDVAEQRTVNERRKVTAKRRPRDLSRAVGALKKRLADLLGVNYL